MFVMRGSARPPWVGAAQPDAGQRQQLSDGDEDLRASSPSRALPDKSQAVGVVVFVPILPGRPAVTLGHGTSSLTSGGVITFACGPVTGIIPRCSAWYVAVVMSAVLVSLSSIR